MDIKKLMEKRAKKEIATLNSYLDSNRLVIFVIAKKLAGKGTYSKYLTQVTDERLIHISVGDIVRETEELLKENGGTSKLVQRLEGRKLGSLQFDDIVDLIVDHSTKKLLPTELVLALLESRIEDQGSKSIIIDGFPRTVEQVKDLLVLKKKFEKDGSTVLFVNIKCPEEILRLRMEGRRVCPYCQTARHIDLLTTDKVGYDPESTEFYLICDNPKCKEERMIVKKGDEVGYESVVDRNRLTGELMKEIEEKFRGEVVEVENSVPVSEARNFDKRDFTERAFYSWDKRLKKVRKRFGSLIAKADDGKVEILSRYAEPVVVELVQRIAEWLKDKDFVK